MEVKSLHDHGWIVHQNILMNSLCVYLFSGLFVTQSVFVTDQAQRAGQDIHFNHDEMVCDHKKETTLAKQITGIGIECKPKMWPISHFFSELSVKYLRVIVGLIAGTISKAYTSRSKWYTVRDW